MLLSHYFLPDNIRLIFDSGESKNWIKQKFPWITLGKAKIEGSKNSLEFTMSMWVFSLDFLHHLCCTFFISVKHHVLDVFFMRNSLVQSILTEIHDHGMLMGVNNLCIHSILRRMVHYNSINKNYSLLQPCLLFSFYQHHQSHTDFARIPLKSTWQHFKCSSWLNSALTKY